MPPFTTTIPHTPPTTLVVVAGVDPQAGAGLLRDVITAQAHGVPVYAVGTAWTRQGAGVHEVEAREPQAVAAALADALQAAGTTGGSLAVKIGMLATRPIAEAVFGTLAGHPVPVVWDPVLASSRGGLLWCDPVESLEAHFPRATLLTPNLPELALLTGQAAQDDSRQQTAEDSLTFMEAGGQALLQRGARAVLVKGGHGTGEATDLLVTAQGTRALSSPRLPGPSPRGTGCTLATAIALRLAAGQDLETSVQGARAWLLDRMGRAVTVGDERHLPRD